METVCRSLAKTLEHVQTQAASAVSAVVYTVYLLGDGRSSLLRAAAHASSLMHSDKAGGSLRGVSYILHLPSIDNSLPTSAQSPTTSPTNMDPQIVAQIVHTLQTTAIAAVIFAACVLLPKLQNKAQLGKLPTASPDGGEKARQAFIASAKKLYRDGYHNVQRIPSFAKNPSADHMISSKIAFSDLSMRMVG